ncbi:MAG: hypothetical protein K0M40_22740 [Prolixibacteraceae bacterium]|nr:hypothetical protein [Prolixibacteraceae bacterium]
MKYEITNPKEDLGFTRDLLNKRWNANTRAGRQEKHKLNAADCTIYMRGQVWIIEHENDLLYYETHSDNYPFFEMAFHYMNVQKRAAWKTVGELITFRQAIREATVQGTDYCETILEEPLTTRIYKKFMRFARSHDLCHHGSHTF